MIQHPNTALDIGPCPGGEQPFLAADDALSEQHPPYAGCRLPGTACIGGIVCVAVTGEPGNQQMF